MALALSSDTVRLQIVVVAATLLTSCLSAPADPWWYHPCNTEVARIRHGRSATDPTVLVGRQLRIFIQQLNISIRKINVLYKEQVSKMAKAPFAKLKWLKIKRMMKDIKKPRADKLHEFHKSLQYFAGTLEVLRNKKIETSAVQFDQGERDSIYQNITFHMRSLLCEVQESLKNPLEYVPLSKMKVHLPQKLDLTVAHLLDLNFFKKTKNFFSKSQKAVFTTKTKKKKNVTSAVKNKRT